MPTIARIIPIPIKIIGKEPLLGSLLDKYDKTKSKALTLNGAIILATFIGTPVSVLLFYINYNTN